MKPPPSYLSELDREPEVGHGLKFQAVIEINECLGTREREGGCFMNLRKSEKYCHVRENDILETFSLQTNILGHYPRLE